MKKYLLSIGFVGLVLSSANVSAQSFTTEVTTDTLKVAILHPNMDVYNKITNTTSSNIKVDWKVVASDFPASWLTDIRLGICDNALCRNNAGNQLISGTTFTSGDYLPSVEGDFHFQLIDFLSATPGTHYMTINYKENGGTYNVDKTFLFTVWPTSVNSVQGSEGDEVVIYPNPATDKLNVLISDASKAKTITIHNFVGKEVQSYNVTSKQMSINIKNIPTGMYYMRVADENGRVFQTKRFTHR